MQQPSYHDLIRAELLKMGGGKMPNTDGAERQAQIDQINRAQGRSLFGGGGRMPAAAPTAAPAAAQTPASAPTPSARPMDSAIEEQMEGEVPTPSPRPAPAAPAQQQGDAGTMEAMGSALEQAIARQVGEPEVPVAASTPSPVPQQSGGMGGNEIAAILASLGGAAGVSSLIMRYRMGDPDAMRTFEAIGMSPDDLSMFAGEPGTQLGGRTAKSADDGSTDAKAATKDAANTSTKPKSKEPVKDGTSKDVAKKGRPTSAPATSAEAPEWYRKMGGSLKPKVKVK